MLDVEWWRIASGNAFAMIIEMYKSAEKPFFSFVHPKSHTASFFFPPEPAHGSSAIRPQ
jgi:hypothetical protein